ncbi:MAG: DNA-binding protein HU [Gammaproteobacteria bacterium RIFCSPHIGHO2_12_FULL_41_20]|nr:MAG: DNA-binding protein HU [Gammaproteobacteria bacterium RIFCSPHIGHO2_12_FULL_41_20]
MNRSELIDLIADQADITKGSATRALDALIDSITHSLKKGDPVVLMKLGSFIVKQRPAREGRNPQTGEKIKIKATKIVSFKAGKALKEAVKEATKE